MFRLIFNFALYRSINLLFPLLTIPLIVKYSSATVIGNLFILQSFAFWISLFVDFGFIRTSVVDYLNENENKVFNRTTSCQVVISVLLVVIVFPLLLFYGFSFLEITFVLISGIIQGIVPKWLYQAESRMLKLSLIESFSKIIALLYLFIFLKDKPNIETVIFSYLLMSLTIVISIIFDYRNKYLYFRLSSIDEIKEALFKTFVVFKMRVVGNGYLNLNVILLSFLSSPEVVAVYGVCERLAKALSSILTSVGEAIFPISVNRKEKSLKKDMFFSLLSSFFPTVFMFIFPNEVINILVPENSIDIGFERVIFIAPALFSLSSVLSLCYVTSKGKYKADYYIQVFILLSSLVGLMFFYSIFNDNYPYYSFALSSFISFVMYGLYVLKKEGFHVISKKG